MVLVVFISLIGCSQRRLESKINELELESAKNRESIEMIRRDLESLRKIVSEMEVRTSSLEDRLNRARNNDKTVEEIARLSREIERVDARVRELEERSRAGDSIKLPPLSESEANLLISKAEELLLAGNVDEAYAIVKSVSARGYLSPEMKMIEGEVLFRRQDYRGAIREWLTIVQDEGKVKNVMLLPRVYLRLANAFLRLGDSRNAELMLQVILSRYPTSPEAKTAADLIRQIGGRK